MTVSGYNAVYRKFKNGDWTIDRVHEFIKMYNNKVDNNKMGAHSPSMAVFGTLILWLGWLMFNAGSSGAVVGEDGSPSYLAAERAIINTVLAPAAGGLFTLMIRKHITGENKEARLDFGALTNGLLAGLVCVTASCDCIEPWAAVLNGLIGGVTYCCGCLVMNKLKVDDPVDAF
jgi:Amt family ammonium transporter